MNILRMSRQLILLGAPTSSSLSWNGGELLTHPESRQIQILDARSITDISKSPAYRAEWRELRHPSQTLEPSFLHDSVHQQNLFFPDPAADFFRTADVTSFMTDRSSSIPTTIESSGDVLSEFYDHSFAVIEETGSSQLNRLEHEESAWQGSASAVPNTRQNVPSCHLSDLVDIPDARYLRSIVPQTMTVNLIVGIMSLPTPRIVTTGRRWGKEKQSELVEILVGDETKSGFGITLWLSENSELRKQIQHLCLRDIVLFRNVALSSFRDQVYGQSLRRGVTKLDLLHGRTKTGDSSSRRIHAYAARDINDDVGKDPQSMKVQRVEEWMDSFVYDQSDARGMTVGNTGTHPTLPPDTQ